MIKVTYKNDEYIYREFYKYYLFRRPTVFAFWIILIATYFMQLATDRGNWELVSFFPLFMFFNASGFTHNVLNSVRRQI